MHFLCVIFLVQPPHSMQLSKFWSKMMRNKKHFIFCPTLSEIYFQEPVTGRNKTIVRQGHRCGQLPTYYQKNLNFVAQFKTWCPMKDGCCNGEAVQKQNGWLSTAKLCRRAAQTRHYSSATSGLEKLICGSAIRQERLQECILFFSHNFFVLFSENV